MSFDEITPNQLPPRRTMAIEHVPQQLDDKNNRSKIPEKVAAISVAALIATVGVFAARKIPNFFKQKELVIASDAHVPDCDDPLPGGPESYAHYYESTLKFVLASSGVTVEVQGCMISPQNAIGSLPAEYENTDVCPIVGKFDATTGETSVSMFTHSVELRDEIIANDRSGAEVFDKYSPTDKPDEFYLIYCDDRIDVRFSNPLQQ